jgi:hypothetical protein
MRPLDVNYHVIELKAGDFRDTETAAAGQTDNYPVTPIVGRPPGPGRQVREDGRKLTTTQ